MKHPKQANPQRQKAGGSFAGAEGFGEQALTGTGFLCGNDDVQEVEAVAHSSVKGPNTLNCTLKVVTRMVCELHLN